VVPFWINADIIQGPVNAVKPTVDATTFLTMVKTNFPRALISVGWTTRQEIHSNCTFFKEYF